MGLSGSKPDWYPGEPTDSFNAPQCSCSGNPCATTTCTTGSGYGVVGARAQATAGSVTAGASSTIVSATVAGGGCGGVGGGDLNNTKGGREITSLPVVALTDSQVRSNTRSSSSKKQQHKFYCLISPRHRFLTALRVCTTAEGASYV